MKNYTITVNGNTYDVVVEEGSGAAVSAPVSAPKAAAPKPAAPKAAPASAAGSAYFERFFDYSVDNIKNPL